MRVLQVSDVHLGATAVLDRDPLATLDAVVADALARDVAPDVVVATGDLVHEDAGDWADLFGRLSAFGAPVHTVPGNHDRSDRYAPHRTPMLITAGPHWSFAFVDTNRAGRVLGDDGALVDHPDRGKLASRGAVDPADLDALAGALGRCATSNVFVWMHHPLVLHPAIDRGGPSPFHDDVMPVLRGAPAVRGVAWGHLHAGYRSIDHSGITLHGCPSTWLAIDFAANATAPPGYVVYDLHADGRVDAAFFAAADERWAEARALPDWVQRHVVGM